MDEMTRTWAYQPEDSQCEPVEVTREARHCDTGEGLYQIEAHTLWTWADLMGLACRLAEIEGVTDAQQIGEAMRDGTLTPK